SMTFAFFCFSNLSCSSKTFDFFGVSGFSDSSMTFSFFEFSGFSDSLVTFPFFGLEGALVVLGSSLNNQVSLIDFVEVVGDGITIGSGIFDLRFIEVGVLIGLYKGFCVIENTDLNETKIKYS